MKKSLLLSSAALITAAATFAAEKLAKAFGKDINNLIKCQN